MTKIFKQQWIKLTILVLSFSLGWGCTATHTMLSKRNLSVQTRMSDSIFLEPNISSPRTVYIQTRNTTGNTQIYLDHELERELTAKGYTIVNNPDHAQYMIQANILRVSKMNLTEANRMLEDGFGGGILGAATAGALGANGRTSLGVGIGSAVIGAVASAVVKDNYYTLITDVRISERTGKLMTESLDASLDQGRHGKTNVKGEKKTHWKRYQTRIVSSANQVNLQLEEALPEMVFSLANSISGTF